jgi:hypothetical protein
VLRLQPGIPEAPAIRALFDDAFTPRRSRARPPTSPGRRRAASSALWLGLAPEAAGRAAGPRRALGAPHQPLADAFAQRFRDFLPMAAYPIRTGVHSSTAFALALATDYAGAAGDEPLLALFEAKARAWHLADRDAQAWEPSGDDFLSATLVTAECLRRLLPLDEWREWFAAYLPHAAEGRPASLFAPAIVTDRTDGKIVHLDGLNLSRAWCWREIAAALPPGDAARPVIEDAARRHLAASLPHVAGDYMGEHWLASFALIGADQPG